MYINLVDIDPYSCTPAVRRCLLSGEAGARIDALYGLIPIAIEYVAAAPVHKNERKNPPRVNLIIGDIAHIHATDIPYMTMLGCVGGSCSKTAGQKLEASITPAWKPRGNRAKETVPWRRWLPRLPLKLLSSSLAARRPAVAPRL